MITNSLEAKNSTQNHNKNSCGENRKIHIDLIVQQFLMFGPNGRKFPETMSQLPKFCRESSDLLEEIRDYFEQCENEYNRDLAKIVLYSLRRMIRIFCHRKQNKRPSRKLKRLIAASSCVNRYRLEFTCLDRYTERSWPLIGAQIDTMQCMDDFNDSRECLHNDRDLFHEFVEQIFSNVINVFCVGENSLDSLDHCQLGSNYHQSYGYAKRNETNKNCNDERKLQTDLIVQYFITFGKNGRSFPETFTQLNDFCDESKQSLEKIEKYYLECESKYNQDLSKIGVYSLRHIIRTLLAVAPCLNRYNLNFKCLDRYAERSWPLVKAPIDAMECLDRFITDIDCIRHERQLLTEFVDDMFLNMINALCIGDNAADSDRCERLKSTRPKFKNSTEEKSVHKFKSFLMASFEILNSIQE
ncbi:hypothetical protein DERF_010830 [Dermatophagoides farinae]|uniref:Uncharacterized protein n=1 Tax=Dermatophagoides farinae TaxID=6954 RepID=A0A922HV19_DERFA|nr:hypothetical protein DERF_010830 [Dermatophagoides farinae]